MAKDPAFLMYYKDILVSSADWDADELGWYTRLICHQADKPEGLPNDLEKLAILAGVKMSQFERFKECWKRTLQARFKANDDGLLADEKQAKVLTERKEYTEKQSIRGSVGAFIKKNRALFPFTDKEWKDATRWLIDYLKHHKPEWKAEGDKLIIQVLKAYASNIIVDANAIGNAEVNKTQKEPAQKAMPFTVSDETLAAVFDEVTRETLLMTFRDVDVDEEWKYFRVKVRGAPEQYAHRDVGTLRLAFNAQLRNAKKKKHDTKPGTKNRDRFPTTF